MLDYIHSAHYHLALEYDH